MNQPVAQGLLFSRVSGGTSQTIVSSTGVYVERVILPGTYVGTLALYNSATVAGTTAANNFLTLGLPTSSIPQSIEVGINCNAGLVYDATGTPLATIAYGK